jgi:hypothetical protein
MQKMVPSIVPLASAGLKKIIRAFSELFEAMKRLGSAEKELDRIFPEKAAAMPLPEPPENNENAFPSYPSHA